MAERSYSDLLGAAIGGEHLSQEHAYNAFGQIMSGKWTEAQTAGLLVALASKGEAATEIAGAAMAMRDHVRKIDNGGFDVIDTCGTGGTGLSTFNISTAAALVAAGVGVKVAKHGNRTNTRASGSADVLTALGVNIEADVDVAAQCLKDAGVCFCFAVLCHPAMKYAAPIRKQLGVRTIFNVLGPLTNPAGAKRQLMGVFNKNLTEVIAEVMAMLGTERAMVVASQDGLDEISTTAETKITELRDGKITTFAVAPEDFGLPRGRLEDLMVDSPQRSAEVIGEVLAGQDGPARDIVLLNAAAAVAVAGRADDIASAIPMAAESIDCGAAAKSLKTLIAASKV